MNKLKKIIKYTFEGKLWSKWKKRRNLKSALKNRGDISKEDYLKKLGIILLGYEMNLNQPKTFNEWINWYKLNYHNDLLPLCVDKLRVDEYVRSKGLESIIVKKYCSWKSYDEMDFTELPSQFVLKTNHDSGGVVVVKDKKDIKKSDLKKIKISFEKDFNDLYCEWPYGKVEKRIFTEEYLVEENSDGHSIKDYKFFCFNGQVKFLYVASERDVEVKFDFFDIDWNWIKVENHHKNMAIHPSKPSNLAEMIKVAEILSEDFPFVRIDLYNVNGQVKFGEMTFYHMAGLEPFVPESYDRIFGEYFCEIFKNCEKANN